MSYRVIYVNGYFSQKGAMDQLIKEVNEAIAMGWEPIGGICLHGPTLAQAMVKRR